MPHRFVAKLEALLKRYRGMSSGGGVREVAGGPLRITVVGGGAGGVEVALSLQYRLEQERATLGMPEDMKAEIT